MPYIKTYTDLHLHLDGAINLKIVKKLAKIQQIPLNFSNDEEILKQIRIPEEYNNLNDFLKCFAFPLSLLQTPKGLTEAVRLVLNEAKKNGCIYAEVRYAPQLHTEKGMSQEEAIRAALKGLKKSSLKANLILCLMRGENNDEQNLETVNLAKKYLVEDGGVVAIDLAGAEGLYPTSKYKTIFEYAKSLDIPFTIHSGETEDAEGVKLAIEYGAKRIGHGVRIQGHDSIMNLVKDSGVCLELCPTSNLLTSACLNLKEYPALKFMNYGIDVCINTDDPAIEGVNIIHEFNALEAALGLTKEQEILMVQNAIKHAFTTDKVKTKLLRKIR